MKARAMKKFILLVVFENPFKIVRAFRRMTLEEFSTNIGITGLPVLIEIRRLLVHNF